MNHLRILPPLSMMTRYNSRMEIASSQSSQPSHEVPADLLKQLHEANLRFHEKKLHVEEMLKSTEYDHEDGVEEARQGLKEVELELEEITRKINEAMAKSGS